jgi:AraC family transcriptional regulator
MPANPRLQSIDCTSESEMQALGATLLQHASLSSGIDLFHYHHAPVELPLSTSQQHLILMNTNVSSNTYVAQVTEGRVQETQMNIEDAIVVPAHIESSARWNRSHSYLALCLDPITLDRKVSTLVKGYTVELLPQFALPDPLLRNIGLALKAELETPGFAGQLYIDSLLNTLAVHLLRYYCVQKPLSSQNGCLPQAKLNQVLDYIQAHLAQDLTLAELAAIAQVSPNYFATQFKQSLGIAPHQYVVQQRIERAKTLMTMEKGSIAEIAGLVGFADQSHFTRHFKRIVGVTPKKFLDNQ